MTSDTSTCIYVHKPVTWVATSDVFKTPPPAGDYAMIGCRLSHVRILTFASFAENSSSICRLSPLVRKKIHGYLFTEIKVNQTVNHHVYVLDKEETFQWNAVDNVKMSVVKHVALSRTLQNMRCMCWSARSSIQRNVWPKPCRPPEGQGQLLECQPVVRVYLHIRFVRGTHFSQ